jgi:hypothetical protein
MHSEHRFSDLTESLKNGFLVDNIVLALARAEKGAALDERDRKLLGSAVSILESAEVGYKWPDNPELTDETRSAATFFGLAVSALPPGVQAGAFLESISDLKATAAHLSSGESNPGREKIQMLRSFFRNAAQSELDRTEQLLAGEGSADALKWTVTGE